MNKTNNELLNRWAPQCLKDSMALPALTRLRSDSQYPIPTSTADELPPEGDDILWWHPRALRGWKVGYFEADEEIAPGLLRAGGYCWYLCEGRIGNGPTWWMYPPPAPEETE